MGKKEFVFALCFLLATLSVFFFLLQERHFLAPTFSQNCQDTEVKSVWDSIFRENSDNIFILSGTNSQSACENYFAYKFTGDDINEAYVLSAFTRTNKSQNMTIVYALKGNLKNNVTEKILNITQDKLDGYHMSLMLSTLSAVKVSANSRVANITSIQNALAEYNSIFKPANTSEFTYDQNSEWYFFTPGGLQGSDSAFGGGGVHFSNMLSFYSKSFDTVYNDSICVPNWQPLDTPCKESDIITTYYEDTNFCGFLDSAPPNETRDCDYNNYGIIGNLSDLKQRNINVTVLINNSEVNYTKKYEFVLDFKIKEGSIVRSQFLYNFTRESFNFREASIEKQSPSESLGLLIIDGINSTKTLTVDKINPNSTKVCVRDSSAVAPSTSCSSSSETLLPCPGNINNFNCTIQLNFFTVSGLVHSAAREFYNITSSCMPNWQPRNTSCQNGVITTYYTDLSLCNISTAPANRTFSCALTYPCASNWTCTSWYPEKCTTNETQTRTCLDTNNCGIGQGKPQEARACDYESNLKRTAAIIVVIIVALFALIAAALVIAYILANKKRATSMSFTEADNSPDSKGHEIDIGFS